MKTQSLTRRSRSAGGFTLIEIMLVLAIIALLVGAGIWKLSGVMKTGQTTRVRGDLGTLQTALIQYQISAGSYPPTDVGLRALVEKPQNVRKWEGPYLDSPMLDPWNNEYGYRYPPTKNKAGKPDIFSKGEDGLEGNEDDIGNWEEES